MPLVFHFDQPRVVIMGQPLFRRWFNRTPTPVLETTESQAALGSADAQFFLGVKYANGDGAAQDYEQAAKWYLKAAEQNHVLAQFNLGIMRASGQGGSRNDAEAEVWFGKSARQGDAGAQYHLGMSRYRASLRALPQDVPESRIEAYKWFVLAAAQGYLGSETARDTVVLKMILEDVTEATKRVAEFSRSLCENPPAHETRP